MKHRRPNNWIYAFVAVLLFSCNQETREEQAVVTEDPKKEAVEVMELEPQTVFRTVNYPATLEAYEEVYMAPASP
jgi:membrane fusion protein, multidrug efflux system